MTNNNNTKNNKNTKFIDKSIITVKNAVRRARFLKHTVLPNGTTVPYACFNGGPNDNIVVIGGTGAGKTRGVAEANIISGVGSMIISDTKGTLFRKYAEPLRELGYEVKHLNFIDPDLSMHYNPIDYLNTTNDVQKLSNMIVYLGLNEDNIRDPFWPKAEAMFLNATIGYLQENGSGFDRSIAGLIALIATFDAEAIEDGDSCEATRLFENHAALYKRMTGKPSWAFEQYKKFIGLSQRTMSCVLLSALGDIGMLDTVEMREMMKTDEMDLRSIGDRKTAVFIEVSDTDRSKDTAINLFYTQAMDQLCRYADSLPTHHLAVPVRFILDDFGTASKIEGFENMISNIRSRRISTMIMIQSIAQLTQGYGEGWQTILDNCDTTIYMGSNNPKTAEYIVKLIDKPLNRVLHMPLKTHWLIRRGEAPICCQTVDIDTYDTGIRLPGASFDRRVPGSRRAE